MASILSPGSTLTARGLFREYTNEANIGVAIDAQVDIYLQAGLEAFNRRTQYAWTTDTSSVVLVAGTQEYTLPSDCISIEFVEWNGRELPKSDVERWRGKNIDWRNEPPGQPAQWAHYADKLVLRPKPSAEAVAAAASPVIRYNRTPRSVTTYGYEQIATENQRLPVYFAVAEYAFRLPGAAPGVTDRGKAFLKLFEEETSKVVAQYKARRVSP